MRSRPCGEGVGFEAEAADATNVEPLLTSVAANEPEFLLLPRLPAAGPLLTNTAKTVTGWRTPFWLRPTASSPLLPGGDARHV
jgi:hypothetical protein